jgi:ankyrin repeat protein
MGGICSCCDGPEFNPDESPKDVQSEEQEKDDPAELRKAARDGDLDIMDTLLRRMRMRDICSGATKNEGDPEDAGQTALHFSAALNHIKGCKKLLYYGCPLEGRNKSRKTSLNIAVEGGKRKAASFLLEKGAKVNSAGKTHHYIVVASHTRRKYSYMVPLSSICTCVSFIDCPNQVDVPPDMSHDRDCSQLGSTLSAFYKHCFAGSDGETPLINALASGRMNMARMLMHHPIAGSSIKYDALDKKGNSVVLIAARYMWVDLLRELLPKLEKPADTINTRCAKSTVLCSEP